jgi:SpoVK/Ycf46/Vps4 family AAA+-type ATPase
MLIPPETKEVCRLWFTRILLNSQTIGRCPQLWPDLPRGVFDLLGVDQDAFDSADSQRDDPRAQICIEPLDGPASNQTTEALDLLAQALAALEASPPPLESPIFKNANLLSALFDFGEVETRLFRFLLAANCVPLLTEFMESLAQVGAAARADVIGAALDLPSAEVEAALEPTSRLLTCGLVRAFPRDIMESPGVLRVGDSLTRAALAAHSSVFDLLSGCFRKAPESKRCWEEFDHLGLRREVLRRYLRHAVATKERGVNLLFYGDPGVGKTEFARYLAELVQVGLYEVLVEDAVGNPRGPSERVDSFQICQSLFGNKGQALVLFDEAGSVLGGNPLGFLGLVSPGEIEKSFLTRLLEQNAVPTIWITNEIDAIDPAVVRRFDLCLKMPDLPLSSRGQMLGDGFGQSLTDRELRDSLLATEGLTPSDINKVSKVFMAIEQDLAPEVHQLALRQLFEGHLGARSMHLATPKAGLTGQTYDLQWLNCDQDLGALAAGLSHSSQGTMLFYGPPGTGKTALAHHLSKTLGRPILAKRASDILSAWLGRTEANLAAMFREARDRGALLLLDEADSFLRSRTGAQHSWEVTQVNELLVQMESFRGLFICSTNLPDALDQAAFRRFDLKLRFDFLQAAQAQGLFLAHLHDLGQPSHPADPALNAALAQVRALPNLTPGDFAAVRRKARMTGGLTDPQALAKSLAAECAVKGGRGAGEGIPQSRWSVPRDRSGDLN